MICHRCNLEGAIDLDTGSQCHAELMECIALLKLEVYDWRTRCEKLENRNARLSAEMREFGEALSVGTLEGE